MRNVRELVRASRVMALAALLAVLAPTQAAAQDGGDGEDGADDDGGRIELKEDEFLLVLLDSDDENARGFAEKILARKGLDALEILTRAAAAEASPRWAALGRILAKLDRDAAVRRLRELAAAAADKVWAERIRSLADRVAAGANPADAMAMRIEELVAPLRKDMAALGMAGATDAFDAAHRLADLGRTAMPSLIESLVRESKARPGPTVGATIALA